MATRIKSELWQRLRAARAYSDKTQLDVAKTLGISRAAVALHESRDDAIRTRPSAEQVMAISKLTGVPAEFLMSDAVNPDDVWKYADKPHQSGAPGQRVAPQEESGTSPMIHQPVQDRLTKGFWAAVEFEVVSRDPSREGNFAKQIDAGGIAIVADYLHGKSLVSFSLAPTGNLNGFIMSAAGTILLVERAMHKPMHKHLLMWSRVPVEMPAIAQDAKAAFGIESHIVTTVSQAAEFLLSL